MLANLRVMSVVPSCSYPCFCHDVLAQGDGCLQQKQDWLSDGKIVHNDNIKKYRFKKEVPIINFRITKVKRKFRQNLTYYTSIKRKFMLYFSLFSKLQEDVRNLLKLTSTKMTCHKFIYFKLMSYLKAHIFVPLHCFVQVFLPRKCSAVSSLGLDYIILLYIVIKLPLCSVSFRHYLFIMVFSKEGKIIIQNDYEEKEWPAYKIQKDHSLKNWTYASVERLEAFQRLWHHEQKRRFWSNQVNNNRRKYQFN